MKCGNGKRKRKCYAKSLYCIYALQLAQELYIQLQCHVANVLYLFNFIDGLAFLSGRSIDYARVFWGIQGKNVKTGVYLFITEYRSDDVTKMGYDVILL